MMESVFKKRKKLNLFFVISILLLIVGCGLFALGYGISEGWDVVANWFTSKWAVLLYIFLGLYLLIILMIVLIEKVRDYE